MHGERKKMSVSPIAPVIPIQPITPRANKCTKCGFYHGANTPCPCVGPGCEDPGK